MNPEYLLTVDDVYKVVSEHMIALDELWPENEAPPRKVHIVELIDGIKLKLAQIAAKNADRYESPFEKSAKKIMGTDKFAGGGKKPPIEAPQPSTKTTMQLAHEAAKARIQKGQ